MAGQIGGQPVSPYPVTAGLARPFRRGQSVSDVTVVKGKLEVVGPSTDKPDGSEYTYLRKRPANSSSKRQHYGLHRADFRVRSHRRGANDLLGDLHGM